ncbi:MAG TPA: hypothetical protein VKV73_02370 [Chloroflexota bacterium]|nr:hypothetical protein [Chloroflexota bacterium]
MSLQAPISPASVAVVDLYVARGRLRAEIPMLGFTRLSDLFNNAPGEFIGTSMRMAATINGIAGLRRDLVVRLRDVRLVRPIEENSGPVWLGARRDRMTARVVMDLDDWQVTGDLHLVDRIPWLDFAAAVQNRFISVSNASVRFVGVAEPLECAYMLVNGARISALYEVA